MRRRDATQVKTSEFAVANVMANVTVVDYLSMNRKLDG